MTPTEVFDVAQESIYVLLLITTPVMLIALGVGLLIALFQALTSIQEVTLTFVPKIIAVFIGLILLLPFMTDALSSYAQELFRRMATGF